MRLVRYLLLLLTAAPLCGCRPLALTNSGELAATTASDAEFVDEDTLSGRMGAATRNMGEAIARPFDPATWQAAQEKRRRERAIKRAAAARAPRKPSIWTAWMEPEPKEQRTLKEWFAQPRVTP